jgi:hypothetical protein
MFLAEMIAGHLAKSQALEADALDFLADTACCSRAPLAGSGWTRSPASSGLASSPGGRIALIRDTGAILLDMNPDRTSRRTRRRKRAAPL